MEDHKAHGLINAIHPSLRLLASYLFPPSLFFFFFNIFLSLFHFLTLIIVEVIFFHVL